MPVKQNYDLFISFTASDKAYKFDNGRTINVIDNFKKYLEDHKHPQIKNKRFKVCTYTEDFELAPTVSQAIQNKLRQSSALLVFCSTASAESPYVQEELRYFMEEEKKEIIPVNYLLTPNNAFPEKFHLDVLGVNLVPAFSHKAWKKQAKLESHKLVAKVWQLPLTQTYNRFVRRDRLRKRNRFLISFSLIFVFLITAAIAGKERYKHNMMIKIEQRIVSSGGEIKMLPNGNIKVNLGRVENIKDDDLKSLDYLGAVEAVYLPFHNKLTDNGVSNLKDLTEITSLFIESYNLTGKGLHFLDRLTKLKELSLYGCNLKKDDLKIIMNFPLLRYLSLSSCTLNELDLEYLSHLRQLENLNLNYTQISNEGLRKIQGLIWIKKLSISDANITDSGLSVLSNFRSLEDLGLFHTEIGDTSIPTLLKLLNLKTLRIAHTRISAEGVEQLTTLGNIEKIVVHEDQYSNEEFIRLEELFKTKGIELWLVDF
ncbi:MAG: hypothetical protein COA50_16720 [Flavobacteriaceae bacterium]|nr:MAG: hypothetical protein COA50_16720 [Flavobacteriaceae bacterium]